MEICISVDSLEVPNSGVYIFQEFRGVHFQEFRGVYFQEIRGVYFQEFRGVHFQEFRGVYFQKFPLKGVGGILKIRLFIFPLKLFVFPSLANKTLKNT